MIEERLEIIKENVYMRSEIAKKSRLGIDTSLREELELLKEIERLNNIINELENTIANFIENHTESYIDWKYDREIYIAECNILQKLCDTYFDKLKKLKDSD